jgi:hypothetical protein
VIGGTARKVIRIVTRGVIREMTRTATCGVIRKMTCGAILRAIRGASLRALLQAPCLATVTTQVVSIEPTWNRLSPRALVPTLAKPDPFDTPRCPVISSELDGSRNLALSRGSCGFATVGTSRAGGMA